MSCRSCGAALESTAQYCSQCGARVELGALLGVGTDLGPRTQDRVTAAPVVGPADTGTDSDFAREADRERRPFPLGRALAMVATFLVLTVIGVVALTRVFGSGGPEQATVASSAQTSQTEEEGGDTATSAPAPSQTPSSQAASPTPSPTTPSPTAPSSSAPAPVRIPDGARLCSTAGTDAVASAYAGTERTSCEFSESVRTAYRDEGSPDSEASLRVRSPVTKKWYSLTCDGGTPVRCETTTGAVVILAPASS